MTVSTLRPDGTTTSTGISITGASAHAALSDDSDSTYVDFSFGDNWKGTFTDFTLPAGAIVKSVSLRIRASADAVPGSPGTLTGIVGVGSYTGVNRLTQTVYVSQPSGNPLTFNVFTAAVSGVTDADVDALYVTLDNASIGGPIRVYEVYVDITYVTQPAVTVTAPTSTITTTNLPTVEWLNTFDADGGSQFAYEVKVFTDAQYGAGGFTPDSSASTVTSGLVTLTGLPGIPSTTGPQGTSWQVTATLPDDTYRAYVRVAQSVTGILFWSAWDFEEFTVDVDLPGTPGVGASSDNANGRVTITITDNTGTATTDAIEVQVSRDAGATWEPLRTTAAGGIDDVAYVAATGEYTSASDGTSHALPLPAPFGGILQNDLLVAFVGMDGNPTFTWPEGWSEIKDEAGNGNAVRAGVAWKRAAGGESGTITLTTSASEGGGARILCVRGAHRTAVPEVSTGVSGSGANADPDFVSPLNWFSENTLWIAAMVNDGNVAVTAGPSGYLGFGNTRWANASGAGVATAYRRTISSTEDPGAFTHTAEDTRAFTVAVRARNPLLTVYDYETPNGSSANYRARALHDYNGVFAASDWFPTSGSWTSTSWWLKHPNRPDLNAAVSVRAISTLSRAGRQGVFQPVGSSNVVVVQDTRAPATGQAVLRSLTAAAQDDLDDLLDQSATLLLQSPAGHGGPEYIRVLGHSRTRIVEGLPDASKVWEELEFVVVQSPPGEVVAWP